MADLSKIKLNGTEYDLKDAVARTAINDIPIKILQGQYTNNQNVTISSYITSKELYQITGAVYLYIGQSTNQKKDIYRLVFKNYDFNDGEPLYQFCFVCISTSGIIQILQSGNLFGDKSRISSLTYNTIIIPTTTSQITNDSGYITSYTETDPTVPAWAKTTTKPTYTAAEVGALPDTTTIPTKTSDLTNDSGFITSYTETDPVFTASAAAGISSTDISNWNAKSDFSGSYNDLEDKPTIPNVPNWALAASKPTYTAAEVGALPSTYTAPVTSVNGQTGEVNLTIPAAQVQSDWNATSGMGVILNKPTIPAATTVTNTLASGTLIATINGTNIYAPAYTDADGVSY